MGLNVWIAAPDLAHRRHRDAPIEAAPDDVVSGRTFDDDASNGMSALQLEAQLGVTSKTAWLLTQKLRRSMIDPNRELLEGVVEVDQTEIPFRVGDAFFEPGYAGKILCRSDRGHRARHQQAEAPAQGREVPRHALGATTPRRDRRQLRGVARSLRARQREAGRDGLIPALPAITGMIRASSA